MWDEKFVYHFKGLSQLSVCGIGDLWRLYDLNDQGVTQTHLKSIWNHSERSNVSNFTHIWFRVTFLKMFTAKILKYECISSFHRTTINKVDVLGFGIMWLMAVEIANIIKYNRHFALDRDHETTQVYARVQTYTVYILGQ